MSEDREEPRIKVTYMNLFNESDNCVTAMLGLYIISMDMYLAKCKLIRKKDGSVYVAPPSEEYMDKKTGKKSWGNYFWFGPRTIAFFQSESLKAIKKYCLSKGMIDITTERPGANHPQHETTSALATPPREKESDFPLEQSVFS